MHRFVIVLLLSVGLVRLGFTQTTTKLAAADVKADLTYLYETLAASHYNLYANTPKPVYDQAYQQLYASIHDSLTPPFSGFGKLQRIIPEYMKAV